MQFIVDGALRSFEQGTGQTDKVQVTSGNGAAEILFPATGFSVTATSAFGDGGCFLNVAVRMPHDDPSVIGLMGTPNSDVSDDWMTRDGQTIERPASVGIGSEEGYNYCTTNWCIRNPSESLYTYTEAGLDFDYFMLCDLEFGGSIADIVASASQEILDLCGDDEPCIVDGVMGGLTAAQATLEARLAARETCNAVGGECSVARCCDGLVCIASDNGAKECQAPVDCAGCFIGTEGACKNPFNNVCYNLQAGQSCYDGTEMCHSGNTAAAEDEAAEDDSEQFVNCTGCWPGTSGQCMSHASSVCYAQSNGMCPQGSSPCTSRRALRGHS